MIHRALIGSMSNVGQLLVCGSEPLGTVCAVKMVELLFYTYIFYSSYFFTAMASPAIYNIVMTSLGPVGLDKMLMDDVGVSLQH